MHGLRGFNNMGVSNSMGYGFDSMLLSLGFKLIIFATLVVVGFKVFKHYTDKSNNTMQILDDRFARGEIGEEEYLKKRTILSHKK